jgi:hypothetical protein
MSEVQTPVTTEREITIYATRGGQMKKIMTSATTWGELQPLVRREGFDLSSLLAAENINKSDLVNDLAVLPATAFRLFLRPKQTKSGALDRKECFAAIKAHLVTNPQDKSKFVIDGKNMTQLSTPVVQDLVAKYIGAVTSEASKRVEEIKEASTACQPAKRVVNEVVAEKVVANLESIDNSDLTDVERVQEAIELISTLEDYDAHYKANKHLHNLLVQVSPADLREESEEEAIRREARELGY